MKTIPNESFKERVTTMNLTKHEIKSAIIGMVIGDGCLSRFNGRLGYKVGNAYFQMTHCPEQLEYLNWKKDILEHVSKCRIDNPTEKSRNYHLYSQANPVYTKLFDRFYLYNHKSVDEYLVKMITPLALAIMYMDDGTIAIPQKTHLKETFYLRLCNFDYPNLFLIKKSLKIKFDLDWNITKHGCNKTTNRQYYDLRLMQHHNEKFVNIVKPYIELVPSMMYKLGSYAKVSNVDTRDSLTSMET